MDAAASRSLATIARLRLLTSQPMAHATKKYSARTTNGPTSAATEKVQHAAGDGSRQSTGSPHDEVTFRPVDQERAGDDAGEHLGPGLRRGMAHWNWKSQLAQR